MFPELGSETIMEWKEGARKFQTESKGTSLKEEFTRTFFLENCEYNHPITVKKFMVGKMAGKLEKDCKHQISS